VKEGLEDCARKNVKAAIIFASGYSETGEDGMKQQMELVEIAERNGIRLIGPNCVGLVNTTNGLIGTFSPAILLASLIMSIRGIISPFIATGIPSSNSIDTF